MTEIKNPRLLCAKAALFILWGIMASGLPSCMQVAVANEAIAKPRPKSVRIVYLVSADRAVREDFRKGVETAAKDLQAWYAKQLGGPAFRLNDPVVEVVKSDKNAKWFHSHPNGDPVVKPAQVVEKYDYDGGSFTRYATTGKSAWVESKADGSSQFRFAETGRDKQWIRLFDSSRDMTLRLPVGGGTCSWSTDDGKTWNALYHVDKAK